MCASLGPERMDEFYSNLALMSLSDIGRFLVNMNILALKIRALQMGPKTHNGDFIENGSTILTIFK
jgi:hypothetical protein